MPGITVCTDFENERFIEEFYQRTTNASIDKNSKHYQDYRHDMTIIGSITADSMHLIDKLKNMKLFRNLSGEDLLDVVANMKTDTRQLDFDRSLRPIISEAGICHTHSTIYDYFMKDFPIKWNEKTQRWWEPLWPCSILQHCNMISALVRPIKKAKIYFHGTKDILNLKRSPQSEWYPTTDFNTMQFEIDISAVSTSNRTKMFGIESRKCRFEEEITSNRSYPLGVYTQNFCLMECSADIAVKLCGCRPFLYNMGPGPICNVTAMICLYKNDWNAYRENCSCLPQCNSAEYSFVRTQKNWGDYIVSLKPKIKKTRIKRDIKFGIHFLVVSIGGAAALFLGCSLISIAEFIYLVTIHVYVNYAKRSKAKQEISENTLESKNDISSDANYIGKLQNKLNYFLQNSNLHGLRYLDVARYEFFDRIYWICIIIVSLIAMIWILVYTLNDSLDNLIVTNFDVIKSNQKNIFPGISICMTRLAEAEVISEDIKQFIQKYYAEHNIDEPKSEDLYFQIMDYAYHSFGINRYLRKLDICEAINSTCGVDVKIIKQMLWPQCNNLFNIQFNGRHYYNCNDIFKRKIIYGEGVCYVANSISFYNLDWDQLPLTYSAHERNNTFSFDLIQMEGFIFYILFHSPDEFPNALFSPFSSLIDDKDQEFRVKTTQMINSADIRDLSIEKRQCRFPDERWPPNASMPYSFATCFIYVRAQLEIQLCNCTLHFAPSECKKFV
ncbi:uncharacterized protein LOC116339717 [Contarinia nasturtii]|uniref:uncharacterized protein LOC116339717 n=1 Tax=Contarinia nasturtii TaxID=265458 RepID=UPI0012D4BECF|nr:uncharacterized protein LOC116339717 [Contarinia nasturtii]